jgi:hypothetical protein
MDVDVLGASTLFRLYPRNIILIFIQPAAERGRCKTSSLNGYTIGEIPKMRFKTRLVRVKMELTYRHLFHYLILNEDIAKATQTLNSIIWAERAKRELRLSKIAEHHPVHAFTQTVRVLLAQAQHYVVEETSTALSEIILENEYPCEAAYRQVKQFISHHVPHGQASLPDAWLQTYTAPLYISIQGYSHHEEQIHWFKFELPHDLDLTHVPFSFVQNQ